MSKNMVDKLEIIKSSPYFVGLSPAELDSIARFMFDRVAERSELLLLEDDEAEALFFVISGAVKVFKTSADGKEQILQIIKPGESFNDVPVLSGGLNLASAEAMGEVFLCGIKKGDLASVLREYPQVALNIIQVLSQRVQHLVSLVEDLSFKHVTGRVAKILMETADDSAVPHPRLTQQEMAAMAGTAREMVGRSLKTLEEEGTIRMDHHRIIITNKEALKELAGITS